MRFIPTKVRGIADYLVGLILVALPFLMGWTSAARWSVPVLGVILVVYSLFTDYELGVVRFLRIRFHLLLDAVLGIVLLLLPFLFAGRPTDHWPLFILGALALAFAFTTQIRAEGTADLSPQVQP